MVGCFSPSYGDGEIACGEAGCPPGLSCASDGFCYESGGGPDDPGGTAGSVLALAVANDNGVVVYAYCAGQLRTIWQSGADIEARQVAWGDVDADGLPDLAMANMQGKAEIYELDVGGFRQTWQGAGNRGSRAVALGDVDGDGDDDLLLGRDRDGGLSYYESSNGGSQFDERWQSSGLGEVWELAVGDYNGDGFADVGVAAKGDTDRIYRGDGNGALELVWSSPLVEDTEAVAWGDIDGNGTLELATGGDGARPRVFRHDGAGFVLHWESSVAHDTEAVAFSDLDLDGDLDLAVGNWQQPDQVYRNDAGQFATVWWTSDSPADNGLAELSTESVDWADVDGDGDADLFIGRHEAPNVLLRNDGGQLVEVWRSANSDSTRDAVWHAWATPAGFPDLCSLAQ